jgi:hypothetical protein
VKSRFQNLPFKCNLQRYTVGQHEVWKNKAVFYMYVMRKAKSGGGGDGKQQERAQEEERSE